MLMNERACGFKYWMFYHIGNYDMAYVNRIIKEKNEGIIMPSDKKTFAIKCKINIKFFSQWSINLCIIFCIEMG